jgi:hypothetical protein
MEINVLIYILASQMDGLRIKFTNNPVIMNMKSINKNVLSSQISLTQAK